MEKNSILQESVKYSLNSFYDDATIFVTGATGFLGKLLVRKLLETFPKIKMIYILVRPKETVSFEQRVQEYCKHQIFDDLSFSCPDFPSKVNAVSGDVSKLGLGISNSDVTMLQKKVQIVFNCAASVNLTQPLKISLKINTRSVLILLDICKDMQRLKCILNVSTAISHSHIRSTPIKEEFIPSGLTYQNILQLDELLNSDILEKITPALKGQWLNEYVLTKYLAENICWESELTIGIFRPGLVLSTYRDPVAGWTDNLYTGIGVSTLVQSGVLRCLRADRTSYSHVVPADSCINAMIAAAVDIYETRKVSSKTMVYNYCSADNPMTIAQYFSKHQLGMKYPLKDAIWAPVLFFCSSDLGYKIATLLLHFLPSYLLDFFLFIRGKPIKYMKMYKKIQTPFMDSLTEGFSNTWTYECKNVNMLWDKITLEDRKRLPFHMPDLSWDDYFKEYIRGIGKYLKNQKDEDLPAARRKYFFFRLMNKLFVVLVIGVILSLIWMLL